MSAASHIATRPRLLFAAWAVLVSPLLMRLPEWLSVRPDHAFTAAVPVLVVAASWSERRIAATPHTGVGAALLLLTAPLIPIGLVSHSATLALGGAATSFVGLAVMLGRPPLGWALVALFAVPLPQFLLGQASPGLELFWAERAAEAARLAGCPMIQTGTVLESAAGARAEIFANQNGFVLAHGFALAAWIHALRTGVAGRALFGRLLAGAAAGFVANGAIVMTAAGALCAEDVHAARTALRHGANMLTLAAIGTAYLAPRRIRSEPDRTTSVGSRNPSGDGR